MQWAKKTTVLCTNCWQTQEKLNYDPGLPPAPPCPMILFIVVTFCQDLPVNIHTEAKCGLPFAKQLYADGWGLWWVSMATSTVPDTRPDSQAGHDPSYLASPLGSLYKNEGVKPGMVACTFNSNTGRQRKVDLCRSEASLIYTGVPGQSEIQK